MGGLGGNSGKARTRTASHGMIAALLLSATVTVASFYSRPLVHEREVPAAFTIAAPGARKSTVDQCYHDCRKRRALRMTSANDIIPTDGLTTGSGQVQRGGGGARLESDLHVSVPNFETSMADFPVGPAGSPHFGDIMGGAEGKSQCLLHHFEPLERVVLTANGNLQRVISSYYDSPVTVDIKHCKEVEPSVYDREVTLSVMGREFCVAKSLVVLHSPACVEAVNRGDVGIGQLFRSLDILPNFELLNAGRLVESSSAGEGQAHERSSKGGRLWRVYDLRSRHLSCRIYEEFPPDLFDLATK